MDGRDRRTAVYGDDTPYDTASIIKVDILATLLLQAQDAGRTLDAHERALAEAMIKHSDNDSATPCGGRSAWPPVWRRPTSDWD